MFPFDGTLQDRQANGYSADKSTREEEVTVCQGPNDWEVS